MARHNRLTFEHLRLIYGQDYGLHGKSIKPKINIFKTGTTTINKIQGKETKIKD